MNLINSIYASYAKKREVLFFWSFILLFPSVPIASSTREHPAKYWLCMIQTHESILQIVKVDPTPYIDKKQKVDYIKVMYTLSEQHSVDRWKTLFYFCKFSAQYIDLYPPHILSPPHDDPFRQSGKIGQHKQGQLFPMYTESQLNSFAQQDSEEIRVKRYSSKLNGYVDCTISFERLIQFRSAIQTCKSTLSTEHHAAIDQAGSAPPLTRSHRRKRSLAPPMNPRESTSIKVALLIVLLVVLAIYRVGNTEEEEEYNSQSEEEEA